MGADMKKVIFRGVGTAIITPMKEDGEINYPVFKKLLDRQVDGGADAVVVAGTTGENATLDDDEHLIHHESCVKTISTPPLFLRKA